MKNILLILGLLLLPFISHAQSYSIDWYKVAGGGGTSTNAPYALSGTVGQPDASGALSGGGYTVVGGFWSLVSVVQTPGTPNLVVYHSGKSVTVAWPDTGSYTLQLNTNVANPTGWGVNSFLITTANGSNSITVTSPTGNLFFRLHNP